MLRYILLDTMLFANGEDRKDAELTLCWAMEALVQRNQYFLKTRPGTPRLYESGVRWSMPKQLDGDVEEVQVLRKHLGGAVRNRDVRRALEKIQNVLGGELFADIGRILEKGDHDCDGLACWRVAELRQAGVQAKPFMTSRDRADGGTTYHALVIWPPLGPYQYETSEDPSLLLGMYQPERKAERDEEIRKNRERCEILAKSGRRALGPASSTGSSFDGATLDSAIADLLGSRRRAA